MMRWGLLSGLLLVVVVTVCSAAYGPMETGVVPLKMVTLAQPWWVTCGFAAVGYDGPPEPGGPLTGEVGLPGGSAQVSITVRKPPLLDAAGLNVRPTHVLLTVDANGDKQTEDDATLLAEPSPSQPGSTSSRFSVTVRDRKAGRDVLLGLNIADGGTSASISRIMNPVPAADLKLGTETRRLYCTDAGEYGQRLWLDENGDGIAQPQEEFAGVYMLGTGGALRALTPDFDGMKLGIKAAPGMMGKMRVTVADANGKARPVTRIMGYARTGQIIQLAPTGDVDALAGLSQVTVGVGLGGGREASFSGNLTPPAAAGKLSRLAIRGPVKIEATVEATAKDFVSVSATLKTRSGQQLSGIQGPGETRGKVKVYAPDGTLLSTGFLEYG